MIKRIVVGLLVVVSLCLSLIVSATTMGPALEQALENLAPTDSVDIIITLKAKAELAAIITKRDKGLKRTLLIDALKKKAQATQGRVRALLTNAGISNPRFIWITNSIAATVPVSLLTPLVEFNEIETIILDAQIKAPAFSKSKKSSAALPPKEPPKELTKSPTIKLNAISATGIAVPGWNGKAIHADQMWERGFTGKGVTVAIMDTGVDINHPDLISSYRGGENSWFDPHQTQYPTPTDTNGHGTHVAGVILGGAASGEAIGIAPDATWIAVKVFDDLGNTTISKIHEGFEWLMDPDNNPNTDDAPDIINNSWDLDIINDCSAANQALAFQEDFDILRSAGIAIVFSAGNYGPGPSTSVSPANNPGVTAVGAVDQALNIGYFSSRGPSACAGVGLFPQISAPGENILTADLTFGGLFPNSYVSVRGTSFAAPHYAGALAILKSSNTLLSMSRIEAAIYNSALDQGTVGPDNDYGWGLLDVLAAYNVLNGVVPVAAPPVAYADSATTSADVSLLINITTNDTADSSVNPNNAINPATVSLVSLPTNGVVIVGASGEAIYQPNVGFSGIDQFTYTVMDSDGLTSNVATVTIAVNPVITAAPPVAVDDSASTSTEVAVLIDLITNDTVDTSVNPNNAINPATVFTVTAPTNGVVAIDTLGNAIYQPNIAFAGIDQFTYTVMDNDGLTSNVATVTITVNPVITAAPPVAVDDRATTSEDVTVVAIITNNDTADRSVNPNNAINSASIRIVSMPTNGTIAVGSLGDVTYQPTAGFVGVDQFTYTVMDFDGLTSNIATVTITVVAATNNAPIANAGFDQAVNEQMVVNLDGTASVDTDGQIVSFVWTQLSGPLVTISGAGTPVMSFVAPIVPASSVLTFQLTVTDNGGASATDLVNVTVNPLINQAPVANAGFDQAVNAQMVVNLDGSASVDTDGQIVSFVWTQISGPLVTISGAGTPVMSFVAPIVPASSILTFQLTVTDNVGASATDLVNVTVNPLINQAPVANAGLAQTVTEGSLVNLLGSGTDSDGVIVSYSWRQTAGPTVTSLVGASSALASFTAPAVTLDSVVTFELTVTDNSAATGTATVDVTVQAAAPPPPPPPVGNNLPPITEDDEIVFSANATGGMTINTMDLLANDVDDDDPAFPIGASVMVIGSTMLSDSGSVIVNNGDGTLTYTPATVSAEVDEFNYVAIDALGAPSTSTAVVKIILE